MTTYTDILLQDTSNNYFIPYGLINRLGDVDISNPTTGQNLTYDETSGKWKNSSTSATVGWGGITGTLSDQTDLQNALNGKQPTLTAGTGISISSSTISATDPVLINNAAGSSNGVAIKGSGSVQSTQIGALGSASSMSTSVGFSSYASGSQSISIGHGSEATAAHSYSFGEQAKSTAKGAFQFGYGTNNEAGTVQFGLNTGDNNSDTVNYKLLGADGIIPDARISSNIARTSQIPTVPTNISSFTNDSGYITGISSSDVTTALGYTPVNKTGDTMSGDLSITKVLPELILTDNNTATNDYAGLTIYNNHIDYTSTTAPSLVNNAGGAFRIFDVNSNLIGGVYTRHNTGNNLITSMGAYRKVGNDVIQSEIDVAVDVNGNPYCNFPNTKRVDGQWIMSKLALAENVTWTSSYTSPALSLSNYLPNDGYDYEVLLSGELVTGTTSGQFVSLYLTTDLVSEGIEVASVRTRSASSLQTAGTVILPVGSGRWIKQYKSTSSNANGTFSLYVFGYRRIGTNS